MLRKSSDLNKRAFYAEKQFEKGKKGKNSLRTPPFRVGNCAFCLDWNSTSVILGCQCRDKCTPTHKFSELKLQSTIDKPPFWPIFRPQKMPQNRRIAYLFTPKMGGYLNNKLHSNITCGAKRNIKSFR